MTFRANLHICQWKSSARKLPECSCWLQILSPCFQRLGNLPFLTYPGALHLLHTSPER